MTSQKSNELINHSWALETFLRLVKIDSPSGGEKELAQEIAKIVTQELKAGTTTFDNCHQRFPPGVTASCGNLFIDIPGDPDRPILGLSAHMDRVEPGRGIKPQVGEKEVRSDGSTILAADDVSGIAAILAMVEAIKKHQLKHPPLQLIFTVGEETGVYGAKYIDPKAIKARAVVSFDGNEPEEVVIGGCASDKFRLALQGKAAHAGIRPEAGVSAIEIAGYAISRLKDEGWLGKIKKEEKKGVANLGTIQGGTGTNIVPERVEISGEARSFDEEFLNEIITTTEAYFRRAARLASNSLGETGKVEHWEVFRAYPSWRLNEDAPVVKLVTRAVSAVGLQPRLATKMGGYDASNLNAFVPTVVLGTGAQNGHTLSESLDLEKFRLSCAVALALIREW